MLSSIKKHWVLTLLAAFFLFSVCVVGIAIYAVYSSPTYQQCTTAKTHYPNNYSNQQQEKGSAVLQCLGVFIDQNQGAVNSISTVLIAVFTVVLAWATIVLTAMAVSQEKTSKMHERAYLIGGSLLGTPKIILMGSSAGEYRYPIASDFHEPKRFVIYNYGRTPAYVISIEYGFYPYSSYKEGIKVSDIIDQKLLGNIVSKPEFPGNVIPPTGLEPFSIRQIEKDRRKYIDQVFFGRIAYWDIFGDTHHSTFQYWLKEDVSEPLGTYYEDQS